MITTCLHIALPSIWTQLAPPPSQRWHQETEIAAFPKSLNQVPLKELEAGNNYTPDFLLFEPSSLLANAMSFFFSFQKRVPFCGDVCGDV